MAAKITEPHQYYKNMRVEVTGKVILREDRPYIEVRKVSQIKLVCADEG